MEVPSGPLPQPTMWNALPEQARQRSRQPTADWAEAVFNVLVRHFGAEGPALEFMRFAAGCHLEMPPAVEVEKFATERRAARRLVNDPSQAAALNLEAHYGLPAKDLARIHLRRNGLDLSVDRQGRREWAEEAKKRGYTCRVVAGELGLILLPPRLLFAASKVSI